ncbi:MAG TPA: hypothetical protein VHE30_19630 [Polyangiaceae bacterium]|nr:hypothetical protein [Polyangiaceae bacterium]
MKSTPWLAFLLISVASCGETKGNGGGCTPGQSISCAGENGCTGHQVCRADGAGFDGCICAQQQGTGDGGALAEKGPHSGLLGAECLTDDECRPGMICLGSTTTKLGGEGPGNGLCSADCTKDASTCTKLDPKSTCVLSDPADKGSASYCFPNCALGNPGADDDKCRSRGDLACTEQTAGSGKGYCRPACQNDGECAPRHCNLSTGLCADLAPTGSPIGAACTPSVSCTGGCLEHNASYSECSGACTLGAVGCGENRDDGPPYDTYCLIEPRGSGLGDLGYCAKLCDCDSDCGRTDSICSPTEPSTQRDTGRKGVCSAATYADGSPRQNLPCAN